MFFLPLPSHLPIPPLLSLSLSSPLQFQSVNPTSLPPLWEVAGREKRNGVGEGGLVGGGGVGGSVYRNGTLREGGNEEGKGRGK